MTSISQDRGDFHGLVRLSPLNWWQSFADALRPCSVGDTLNLDLNEFPEIKDELLAWAEARNVSGTVENDGGLIFYKAEVCRYIGNFLREDGFEQFTDFLNCIVMLRGELLDYAAVKSAEYEKLRAEAS
jgi:hypothetical protein